MAGPAPDIERTILKHRLPLLEDSLSSDEFVMPHYDGYSIVNAAATTAALFGIPFTGTPTLPRELWASLSNGVRCVVQILIDALGYYHLRRFMDKTGNSLFHRFEQNGGLLFPLTSVCPSTTTAALSSLWTGRTPIEHGMLGTRLFLRDQGLRANMIHFTPAGFLSHNVLVAEGIKPSEFLQVPGLAEILADNGVESHVFISQQYVEGGLSEIFFRGVKQVHAFVPGSGADLWTQLRELLNQRVGEKLYVAVYWGLIDALAHLRGPSSSVIDAELHRWTELMDQELLQKLSPLATAGTALCILSDHGQVETSPTGAIRLDQHPGALQLLLMKPLGEQRLPYLFVRQGKVEKLKRYFREHLCDEFVILDSKAAVDAGLFGPAIGTEEALVRVGDVILVARGDHSLFDEKDEPHLRGLHGGLSPEEVLVPCLFVRLDG